MMSASLPTVPVEQELLDELKAVLGESETVGSFVEHAVRGAVTYRRAQVDFLAQGEAAWQDYLRTGHSSSVAEVFDRVDKRIALRRQSLKS